MVVVCGKALGWVGKIFIDIFEVGMGNRVRFWLDCWCGDQSLKEAFLVLYDIATD